MQCEPHDYVLSCRVDPPTATTQYAEGNQVNYQWVYRTRVHSTVLRPVFSQRQHQRDTFVNAAAEGRQSTKADIADAMDIHKVQKFVNHTAMHVTLRETSSVALL